jgi:hypothetical protein
MPEKLSCGVPKTLVVNTVYALPPHKCTVYSDTGSVALEQSNDTGFATKSTVTLTGGMGTCAALFLRATSAGVINLVRD